MIKPISKRIRINKHGQSFVELMLIVPILALMLAGVVEYGMLLNNYLKVLDGTREGARLGSQAPKSDLSSDLEKFFVLVASKSLGTMTPINLNGNRGDDLIISVIYVDKYNTVQLRTPDENGWSLCAHYSEIMTKYTTAMQTHLTTDQYTAFVNGWNACTPKTSKITSGDVQLNMDSPDINTGIILVEAYYDYPQMLKLPIIEQIGDPIPVYTYSMMPMASAMTTPVPPTPVP